MSAADLAFAAAQLERATARLARNVARDERPTLSPEERAEFARLIGRVRADLLFVGAELGLEHDDIHGSALERQRELRPRGGDGSAS